MLCLLRQGIFKFYKKYSFILDKFENICYNTLIPHFFILHNLIIITRLRGTLLVKSVHFVSSYPYASKLCYDKKECGSPWKQSHCVFWCVVLLSCRLRTFLILGVSTYGKRYKSLLFFRS